MFRAVHNYTWVSSSTGRAPVSKTGGWGFKSLLACEILTDQLVPTLG